METAVGPGWGSSACSQVLKVFLSRADTRVLPISEQATPCERLAGCFPTRESAQEHRRTLGRVSSRHWSQPTAGLQEKCSPLIQDQKHFSNRSPESAVTVWLLMTRSRLHSQVQRESSSGRPRQEPYWWTGGWEWGWGFIGGTRSLPGDLDK